MSSESHNLNAEGAKFRSALVVSKLNKTWGFSLEIPKEKDSPMRRSEQQPSIQREVVYKIYALGFKNAIDPLVQEFDNKAAALYTGWVNKPKAERGIIPEKTRHATKQITEKEKVVLLQCLLEILNKQYELLKTPGSKRHFAAGNPNASLQRLGVNDSPLPLKFPSKTRAESKRVRDQLVDIEATFKKPKLPEQTTNSSRPQPMHGSFGSSISAQTSFLSEASSVFSNPHPNSSSKSLPDGFTPDTTQSSAPERQFDTEAYREDLNFEPKTQSSDYEGASHFDADLVAELYSDLTGVGQRDAVTDDELSQEMDHSALANKDILNFALDKYPTFAGDGNSPNSDSTEDKMGDTGRKVSDSVACEDKLREHLQGVFRK